MNSFAAVVLLYLELLLALALMWREGLLKTRHSFRVGLVLAASAFLLRYLAMDHETYDYIDWISRWVQHFRDKGAWPGLGEEIWACNYNVPYLYFLAVFSQLNIYDLYTVKLLSILFDILLAWGVLKLVSVFCQSESRRLIAFLGTLWLPTVFLNGAYWGQCDSLYVSLCIWSLYLVLRDRPLAAVAVYALSFSLKLQAIFLMPAFLAFIIARRMKFWHLLAFPVTYVLTLLPAVLAGRSFTELLLLYYNNTDSIGTGLNYNSSSMYAISDFPNLEPAFAANIGIVLAFGLCAAIYVWLLRRRKNIDNSVLLATSLVLCLGIPFFLPHMHDRYFFLADILAFVVAVAFPWESLIPILVSFGSLLGYHAYLKLQYLMPMMYGGFAMLFALVLSIAFFAARLAENEKMMVDKSNQSVIIGKCLAGVLESADRQA